MIKTVAYLLFFVLFITSCEQNQSVNLYETKDQLSANLSLNYARTYAGEQLKMKMNGKVIYQAVTDSSLFPSRKLFNIPDSIKTVEIESYYKKKMQIYASYKNTAAFKRISVTIGYPYPRGIPPTYMRDKEGFSVPIQKEQWLYLPLDSIGRLVYIEPDTLKELIILQETRQ